MRLFKINILYRAIIIIVISQGFSLDGGGTSVAVRATHADVNSNNEIHVREARFDDPYDTRMQGQTVASCKSILTPMLTVEV